MGERARVVTRDSFRCRYRKCHGQWLRQTGLQLSRMTSAEGLEQVCTSQMETCQTNTDLLPEGRYEGGWREEEREPTRANGAMA